VAAALALLGREIETHESLPRRRDGDRVWYRLKAAAARFLGDAKAAEAVPLLIRELTSGDIYPARIACVEALVAIGTPEALAAVQAVPETDEWNTAARSRLLTGGNVDAH
jgi:HEAT repeat protein